MSSVIDEYNDYGGEKDVTESVKVRLYPTEEQKSKINQNIGNRGFIWNKNAWKNKIRKSETHTEKLKQNPKRTKKRISIP